MSSFMSLWSNILFNCAVLINLIVAFFYPFVNSVPSKFLIKIETFSDYILLYKYVIFSLFSVLRIQSSHISSNLDSYACFCFYRSHFTKRVWHTCVGCVNNIAVNYVYRTRTNIVVTWFSYGKNIKFTSYCTVVLL